MLTASGPEDLLEVPLQRAFLQGKAMKCLEAAAHSFEASTFAESPSSRA